MSHSTSQLRSTSRGCAIGLAAALVTATLLLTAAPAQAATGRAYVSNFGTDTVSVVDTATNAILTVIAVGDGPTDVDISPDGARAYVVNRTAGTVSVIATASNTVVATVPVGANPRSVSVTPDGTRARVTRDGGATTVIDTASNTEVGTAPALLFSPPVAFSPDGTRAYGTTDHNTLVVIDTATLTAVAQRPVGSLPTSVEVSPDGSRVYASGYTDVRVFDTATNTQVGLFDPPVEITDAVLSPDGTRLYLTQYHPTSVLVVDTATLAVVATVPLQNHPWAIDLSPTGDRLYVAVGPVTSEGVVVIDTATNAVVTVVQMSSPADVAATSATSPPPPAPVIDGATFYTDGTSTRSGVAPGARVSLFATSAVPGLAYQLVLSRDGCRTAVAVLNLSVRYANDSGFIGSTAGTIPAGTPAGRYQICFWAPTGGFSRVTGPVTLDVV